MLNKPQAKETEREVVILLADMVGYSRISSNMSPTEIRDFLTSYNRQISELIDTEENHPLEVELSAGDGCLIVFDKRQGEGRDGICTRALRVALTLARAVEEGQLIATRMGILLGEIVESRLGPNIVKFGTSFATAKRLEELCDFFGTILLMDRDIAIHQRGFERNIVDMAKVGLTSVQHPMHLFTLYAPGIHQCSPTIAEEELDQFIMMKNQAMAFFSGNRLTNRIPNFPIVRSGLTKAQELFEKMTGKTDTGIQRILEYIRENPTPGPDFARVGITLTEKKQNPLGRRLHHLSNELFKAIHPDLYQTLVVDTEWEQYFKLEWHKAGEVIVEYGSIPDGVYHIDSGTVEVLSAENQLLSTMHAGMLFGEIAYFGEPGRRTATVRAKSDVVLRRIATKDLEKLPVIVKIFELIAKKRRQEFAQE